MDQADMTRPRAARFDVREEADRGPRGLRTTIRWTRDSIPTRTSTGTRTGEVAVEDGRGRHRAVATMAAAAEEPVSWPAPG